VIDHAPNVIPIAETLESWCVNFRASAQFQRGAMEDWATQSDGVSLLRHNHCT